MITSSLFFEKQFFTIQYNDEKKLHSQLSPWGQELTRNHASEHYHYSDLGDKNKMNKKRGYQLSRESSIKYIQKKIKQKQKITQPLSLKKQRKQMSNIGNKFQRYANSQELEKLPYIKVSSKDKKDKLFPSLNMNEYHQLKAKGNSLNCSQTIDQIMMKRKNKKKFVEEFGKPHNLKSVNFPKLNKSVQYRPLIYGNQVCAIENPKFTVQGRHTDKLQF